VRLLERSTRNLRLTDVGAQVLEHAQRSAEPSEAVDNLVLNQLSTVARVLRLSAPPSISDTPLAPLLGAFQDELRCQRKGFAGCNRPQGKAGPPGCLLLGGSCRSTLDLPAGACRQINPGLWILIPRCSAAARVARTEAIVLACFDDAKAFFELVLGLGHVSLRLGGRHANSDSGGQSGESDLGRLHGMVSIEGLKGIVDC
jgi:hypothetical protein